MKGGGRPKAEGREIGSPFFGDHGHTSAEASPLSAQNFQMRTIEHSTTSSN
jgi:hypothetical protein